MGGILIITGTGGSIAASKYVEKNYRYKALILILGTIGLAFLVIFAYTLSLNYLNSIIMFAIAGLFVIPVMPLCMELSSELTFPISASASCGALMTSGQIIGIAMILILG